MRFCKHRKGLNRDWLCTQQKLQQNGQLPCHYLPFLFQRLNLLCLNRYLISSSGLQHTLDMITFSSRKAFFHSLPHDGMLWEAVGCKLEFAPVLIHNFQSSVYISIIAFWLPAYLFPDRKDWCRWKRILSSLRRSILCLPSHPLRGCSKILRSRKILQSHPKKTDLDLEDQHKRKNLKMLSQNRMIAQQFRHIILSQIKSHSPSHASKLGGQLCQLLSLQCAAWKGWFWTIAPLKRDPQIIGGCSRIHQQAWR